MDRRRGYVEAYGSENEPRSVQRPLPEHTYLVFFISMRYMSPLANSLNWNPSRS